MPLYVDSLRAHRIECSLGLQKIPVFVVGPPSLATGAVATKARVAVDFVTAQFSSLLTYVVTELLETKNSGWLKDDESPLSEQQFRRNLTPRRIAMMEDGSIEIGFADHGMFWGHEVVLRTDARLQPIAADIEG